MLFSICKDIFENFKVITANKACSFPVLVVVVFLR